MTVFLPSCPRYACDVRRTGLLFAAGGISNFVGDGALSYGNERSIEAFYKCGVLEWLDATLDYQFVDNPGFNASKGPANFFALRLRAGF